MVRAVKVATVVTAPTAAMAIPVKAALLGRIHTAWIPKALPVRRKAEKAARAGKEAEGAAEARAAEVIRTPFAA